MKYFCILIISSLSVGFYGQTFNDYIKKANTLYQNADYKDAIHNYTKAAELSPSNDTTYVKRGLCKFVLKKCIPF